MDVIADLRERANRIIVPPGATFLFRRTYLVSESCFETATTMEENATKATVRAVSVGNALHHESSSASSSTTCGSNQKSSISPEGRGAADRNGPNVEKRGLPALAIETALHSTSSASERSAALSPLAN